MTRRYGAFWGGFLCLLAACASEPNDADPTTKDGSGGVDATTNPDAGRSDEAADSVATDGGIGDAGDEGSSDGAADVVGSDAAAEAETSRGYDGGDAAVSDETSRGYDGGDAAVSDEHDASAPEDPFACLPAGEEQLFIDITGTPGMHLANPAGARCLSRFLLASGTDEALFDLQWNTPDLSIIVVTRTYQVAPGQTGTFTPFSILLATNGNSWASLGAACRVTIASNSKIGEVRGPATVVYEYFKVVGSMTCASGWAAPDKPTDEMTEFRFATRVTLTRTM